MAVISRNGWPPRVADRGRVESVGAGAGIVAFLLGLAWSCIVIAIAWVRFRPIVAGCLLAAAVVLVGFLFMRGRKKAA